MRTRRAVQLTDSGRVERGSGERLGAYDEARIEAVPHQPAFTRRAKKVVRLLETDRAKSRRQPEPRTCRSTDGKAQPDVDHAAEASIAGCSLRSPLSNELRRIMVKVCQSSKVGWRGMCVIVHRVGLQRTPQQGTDGAKQTHGFRALEQQQVDIVWRIDTGRNITWLPMGQRAETHRLQRLTTSQRQAFSNCTPFGRSA